MEILISDLFQEKRSTEASLGGWQQRVSRTTFEGTERGQGRTRGNRAGRGPFNSTFVAVEEAMRENLQLYNEYQGTEERKGRVWN